MKQFYETYKDNKFVSPLVTQISWTNHLLILSRSLSPTLISEYTLKLIDKKLLKQKLHELTEIAEIEQLREQMNSYRVR